MASVWGDRLVAWRACFNETIEIQKKRRKRKKMKEKREREYRKDE
jgi:hypothetical protein